jgi:hypothetical protein
VDALLREVEQLRREMRERPRDGHEGRVAPPAVERGAPPPGEARPAPASSGAIR